IFSVEEFPIKTERALTEIPDVKAKQKIQQTKVAQTKSTEKVIQTSVQNMNIGTRPKIF
ncbi:MAG: hypothetical protein MHPSP_003486, partial [Paramarteilia canceri]